MKGIDIIIITLGIELILLVYALIRSHWVLRERIKIIESNVDDYENLPTYDEMLFGHGFWCWDIDKYITPKEG